MTFSVFYLLHRFVPCLSGFSCFLITSHTLHTPRQISHTTSHFTHRVWLITHQISYNKYHTLCASPVTYIQHHTSYIIHNINLFSRLFIKSWFLKTILQFNNICLIPDITNHASHILHYTSQIIHQTSNTTRQTSQITHQPWFIPHQTSIISHWSNIIF